ncbi:fatty-acid amide hydrolase 2-B [Danaus plexippus]|uniref:fatty-acid amide hydrolase 2-B n=1 Tax=Danaus plexippus TaxID=13037 RepID=UPI002AB1F32B|nr:fatty-acid amide hydrolase 2-B [Danaus plexippus]
MEKEIVSRPIPFTLRVLSTLRMLVDVITSVFFKLYYGTNTKKLPPIKDDILKQPAVEVARRIRNKEISSVEVLKACMQRISDTNSLVNCFVENRYDLALQEAKEADKLVQSGSKTIQQLEKEKPFLGVPFTTKDCIAVKGLHHTAGVDLRRDKIAETDADVIRILRENGAIIIGLTNVPELCMWWETHNHIYGRTSNPYDTTRIVGGSSGGEGCIQALGGSCFGIGSDIGGSIRMPAYFNGIFGHKPSRLIVSNVGQYPEEPTDLHKSFLCIGPMTRFAADLKPILKIISGENCAKLNLDKPINLKNLKIFYQINNGAPLTDKVDKDIVTALEKVVEFFNKKHNIVAEEKKIEWLQRSIPIWMETMKGKCPFGKYIIEDYSIFAVFKEIFKNIVGLSGNTLIALFTSLVDRDVLNPECKRYQYYLKVRQELEDIFKNMLGEDGIFLYPTHPTPAPYHNQPLVKPMNFIYTAIINSLGLPATTVPLGLSRDGLPIGIQVIANHNNDRLCLAVAEELEKAFGGWIEPK